MQDENELMNSLIESLQLDKESIQAGLVRNTIEDVLNLGRKYERKRIREECLKKQFEVELPTEDGFVMVVNPDNIDMWKD